jgi:hypothetical protein
MGCWNVNVMSVVWFITRFEEMRIDEGRSG